MIEFFVSFIKLLICIHVCVHILTFDEPISLKRFILKVAFHVMQDYFRQKYRRLEDPYIKGKINRDELSEEVDTYYNSDAHTDKILNKLDYEKAMARLPGKTREIFQLKGEGYKYEEIANILDVSVSSVKMQVKRGTEKLKVFIFSVTFFVFKTTV